MQTRTCQNCKEPINGRVDQKFCSPYCKSAYHYEANKLKPKKLFNQINDQLKTNRKILAAYNKSGKSSVRQERLIQEGFNPRIFTHYWKAKNGNTYLFVYEYGFMMIQENDRQKYLLVEWQDYMNAAISLCPQQYH